MPFCMLRCRTLVLGLFNIVSSVFEFMYLNNLNLPKPITYPDAIVLNRTIQTPQLPHREKISQRMISTKSIFQSCLICLLFLEILLGRLVQNHVQITEIKIRTRKTTMTSTSTIWRNDSKT